MIVIVDVYGSGKSETKSVTESELVVGKLSLNHWYDILEIP
jgi:hypothetical protein